MRDDACRSTKTMPSNINSTAQLVPLIAGQREREGGGERDESGSRFIDKIATAIIVPLDICVNKIDKSTRTHASKLKAKKTRYVDINAR